MFYIKKIETIGDAFPLPPALVDSITPAYSDLESAQLALWALSWDYPDAEVKVSAKNHLVVCFMNNKTELDSYSDQFTTVFFYIEGF